MLYQELEKDECNINSLISEFDENTQSHITMVMATDYEIEKVDKAIDDILSKYEREKLNARKQEILKELDKVQDEEKKRELGEELSNIIITVAKIK